MSQRAVSSHCKDFRLSLKPKTPQSQYRAIFFIVDPESYRVRQTVLVDSQGNINDMTFKDAEYDVPVAESTFRFKPPKGTRIVDTNQ
jgi:outer membrane lipoprotein-sorting protein